jgi:hypothetical protein
MFRRRIFPAKNFPTKNSTSEELLYGMNIPRRECSSEDISKSEIFSGDEE